MKSLVKKNNTLNNYTPIPFFGREFSDFMSNALDIANFGTITDRLQKNNMEVTKNEEINGVTVAIDLPGVEKENLNVSYEDGFLNVSGERKEEKKDKMYSSVQYGSFSIKKYIGEAREEEIDAELKDGVLRVHIPLKEETFSEKKKIEIK